MLESRQPRAATAVTMITTASASRQHMLQGLCHSWGSVISVAFYTGALADNADAVTKVAADVAAVKQEHSRCATTSQPAESPRASGVEGCAAWRCCSFKIRRHHGQSIHVLAW